MDQHSGASSAEALLSSGLIGELELPNRVVRSATSETMADSTGSVRNPEFTRFYERLADGGLGLLLTGHSFVHPRGQSAPGMTGLSDDAHIAPLAEAVEAVHDRGTRIFAQLNHGGSQSRMPGVEALAPSPIRNPQTGGVPAEASDAEIREVVDCFGAAARRTRQAGFDGVHIHAGHGYLLSEFLSPSANRRSDQWGGSLENRQRLLLEVVDASLKAVDGQMPVTVKLGMRDFVPDGLTLDDALATAQALEQAGVAAIEVSAGLTSAGIESAQQYTGVTRRRAMQDKLVHRAFAKTRPEGYFVEEARQTKAAVSIPVILVGGLRTVEFMNSVIADGIADFVSLARPLIREPDLVRTIEAGRTGLVDCTSCNMCIMHEGVHSLRCWRRSNRDILRHAYHRFTGKLLFK